MIKGALENVCPPENEPVGCFVGPLIACIGVSKLAHSAITIVHPLYQPNRFTRFRRWLARETLPMHRDLILLKQSCGLSRFPQYNPARDWGFRVPASTWVGRMKLSKSLRKRLTDQGKRYTDTEINVEMVEARPTDSPHVLLSEDLMGKVFAQMGMTHDSEFSATEIARSFIKNKSSFLLWRLSCFLRHLNLERSNQWRSQNMPSIFLPT